MDTSDLAKRMKDYESVPKTKLTKRTPVIIRIDGKAFHTFTKGFERPFDEVLIKTMQETTKYLCENIQGCVLGYTQSDEISLVLVDYETFDTSAWFDYEVQKLTSIAASMATMAFNKFFVRNVDKWGEKNLPDYLDGGTNEPVDEKLLQLNDCYQKAVEKGAMFDARAFNIPKEEVTNCIYWRQLDASRNSVLMVGQANFSHKELQNKTCSNIQDMLMTQKGINWNNFPTYQKRGTCVIKVCYEEPIYSQDSHGTYDVERNAIRTTWFIDKNIPLFKGDGREYIEKLVMIGEGDPYSPKKNQPANTRIA